MSTPSVTFERDGALAIITMSRPHERNMISRDLVDGLVDACRRMNDDLAIKCGIITAEGEVFSAGGNLKNMHERRDHFSGNPAEIRLYYAHGVQRLARAFHDLEVPVIAAVNGPAIGAGLDIALMCDTRIASEKALFAESFIRLGMVSAAGGSWFLTRIVGPAVAAELTLTGDNFDAAEALRLGVVSRVVAPDQLMSEARALAGRITKHPSHAIRMNKRLLRESAGTLANLLEIAASQQALAQHTDDHREAVAAVMEKRTASYVNR